MNSNKALVTFIFDDANSSIYDNAMPVFKKFDYPACIAVPSGYYFSPTLKDIIKRLLPSQRKISLKRLKDLQDEGWEIMSHTQSHPRLTEVVSDIVEKELSTSYSQLTQAGFKLRQFVSPYSVFPERYLNLIEKWYEAHYGNYRDRDIDLPATLTNNSNSNPYLLQRINFQNIELETICKWLDYIVENDAWLVLYEHHIGYKNFSSVEKLERILHEIKMRGIEVVTGSFAYDQLFKK